MPKDKSIWGDVGIWITGNSYLYNFFKYLSSRSNRRQTTLTSKMNKILTHMNYSKLKTFPSLN